MEEQRDKKKVVNILSLSRVNLVITFFCVLWGLFGDNKMVQISLELLKKNMNNKWQSTDLKDTLILNFHYET